MRVSRFLVIAVSALALGCSEPTSATNASLVSGEWVRQELIAGNSFQMTLIAQGNTLSGTGSFVGEAGPGGSSTVEGAVVDNLVTLDFTLHTQLTTGRVTSTARFTGQLISGALEGVMQFGVVSQTNPPFPTTFVRAPSMR